MADINSIVEVDEVSHDYISDLVFLNDDSQQFAVTAWDGSISIYQYKLNGTSTVVQLLGRMTYKVPLLCVGYVEVNSVRYVYVGSVQGEILHADFSNKQFQLVQNNQARLGISKICVYGYYLICGSWDGFIQMVDCEQNTITAVQELPRSNVDGTVPKILSMDCIDDTLVVASVKSSLYTLKMPLQGTNHITNVGSGLKFQIRDVKLSPNGAFYVSSSLDGRVAVEFFHASSNNFAFRCHRMNLADSQFVFPVNALCFIPRSTFLYTGGSDGCVSLWNLDTRKKTEQFPKFSENSVVKIACDGRVTCVATSDDSFKTNASISTEIELQRSRIFLIII